MLLDYKPDLTIGDYALLTGAGASALLALYAVAAILHGAILG